MEKKEIREAVLAGEEALRCLGDARQKLASAKNWGIFDIAGGGLFSSMIKHSRIDDASACLKEAGRKLAAFERELKDVSVSADCSMQMGGFLRATDIFLDNVFSDVMVQGHISESIKKIDRTSAKVREILQGLYPYLETEDA